MGSTNQYMSCSFGSRIWEKLKQEVECVIDDVLSLSCDFKHGVMKVEPYVFGSGVKDCETFADELPEDGQFRPECASADVLSSVNSDPTPYMVTWSIEEDSVLSGMMPAADLNDPPEMEAAEEITIVSFGAEPARTTSVPIGYESPYIRALMAETSSAASKSDGYVFDFDHVWDEEEDDAAPEAFAAPEPAEYNFVVLDLSEPVAAQKPNFVMFDLPEAAEENILVPDVVASGISESVETQEPNFVIFDLPEAAEENICVPDLVVSGISEPVETQEPNFVIFDLSEPVAAQEPNFVIFDLPEAAEEKIGMPNFILIYSEEPKVIQNETKDLMELSIPGLTSEVEEMEDACSEEIFLDDDANLAPMLIEECRTECAAEQAPVPAALEEQPLSEGTQISFGFLSGAFGSPGESGIDFLFGKDEEDGGCPERTYEVQTEQSAVRASPVQTQKMCL